MGKKYNKEIIVKWIVGKRILDILIVERDLFKAN